jgi:FKBP-type peptidyl-prolyl cis-trans isomerase SlyD
LQKKTGFRKALLTMIENANEFRINFNSFNKMQITKEKVVAIHYTLKDNAGTVLDTSAGKEPLQYLQGFGNLIPGMEEGMEGKVKGDIFKIQVSPEKGYGVRNEDYVQQVPLEAFGGQVPTVGMQFQAGNDQGKYIVTVAAVDGDTVTVDANHPLAGVELHFDVEVVDVREATSEEIAHGHVHGPGGHHH